MTWKFNPFTGLLDYFKDDYTVVSHSSDFSLSASDLKKIHIMDVSGGERAFWLPEATTALIGKWICLVRKGTTNLLRIWANGTDLIFTSSSGGYIECNEANHNYSAILLVVMEDGVWSTPSYGIWGTY